jgi:replication factor A1
MSHLLSDGTDISLRWTLKARVTQKSERRRWSNAKGEGQLFSVNLLDETGEIKATAFGAAVDELYDRLEEGRVRKTERITYEYSY